MPHAILLATATVVMSACVTRAGGRLEVTVTEAGRGRLPCRVHLTAGGKSVYAASMPRYERDGHFSCPGQFAVDLPAGAATLRIERGPEYVPFVRKLTIPPGKPHKIAAKLVRWIDMNARGWYSGDLHVHRPIADMPLLLAADDVNLAPVLTHWNQRHGRERPPYLHEAAAKPRPRVFHTLAQEDERRGGAILMFNLTEPILLKNITRDTPSGLAYHELALKQKAFIEVEKPFWWEAPVHVALGRVDTIGIACNHFQRTQLMDNEAWGRRRDRKRYAGPAGFARNVFDLYYRYLNLGYQIAASAGSASGVLKNPLGYNRVYVQLDRFGYAAWFDALRTGRNFVTNGPMLLATVDAKPPGTRFDIAAGKSLAAAVDVDVRSRDPLDRAEIIVGGRVAATFKPTADDPRRIAARHRVELDRSTWLAVRAFERVRGSIVRFAHTSPFYVTVGAQRPRDPAAAKFYVTWLDELIAATEKRRTPAHRAAFDDLLATYRRAREVYKKAAANP